MEMAQEKGRDKEKRLIWRVDIDIPPHPYSLLVSAWQSRPFSLEKK